MKTCKKIVAFTEKQAHEGTMTTLAMPVLMNLLSAACKMGLEGYTFTRIKTMTPDPYMRRMVGMELEGEKSE